MKETFIMRTEWWDAIKETDMAKYPIAIEIAFGYTCYIKDKMKYITV